MTDGFPSVQSDVSRPEVSRYASLQIVIPV
jgi:hypothetical protein